MLAESSEAPRTNRNAALSLAAGFLSLATLCIGVIPVPLTGFVCFPISALLCVVALVSGFTAMRQIRGSGASGSAMSVAGIAMGSLTLAVGTCMVVIAIALVERLGSTIHLLTQ